MLVLGTRGEIYLLHLAMRNVPTHMFQIITKVELRTSARTRIGDRAFVGEAVDLDTSSPDQVYFLDRNDPRNEVSLYTFRPREEFVLTEVPDGRRLTFRGDIVRGHFELDQEPPAILTDVVVEVEEIVFVQDLRVLDRTSPHPLAAGKWQGLLFGANGEYFLTHRITLHGDVNQPENNAFHQVFAVGPDTSESLRLDLSSRAAVVEIDGRDAALLPEEGGVFEATLGGLIEGERLALSLETGRQHYFEELMKVNF